MPPITANNNIDNIAIVTMFLPPKCQKYFGFYSIIYDVFIVKKEHPLFFKQVSALIGFVPIPI
jgi:hypothetical protein